MGKFHDILTRSRAFAIVIALLPMAVRAAEPTTLPGEQARLNSGSRAPYVHNVVLYDASGTVIDPAKSTVPYSPTATCGKCHDTDKISHGWHFNAPESGVNSGRPGEPWIFVDEATRTQIPLSSRNWTGTFKPESVGLTPLLFTATFGRHMPGGGLGAKIDDPRGKLSGKLEVDCLLCHLADRSYNPVERSKQIELQNFKWTPASATPFATVKGEARKLPDDYDPDLDLTGDNPNNPVLTYNKAKFDSLNRVHLDITRQAPSDNCYFCHSTRVVGVASSPRWHADNDIHIRAGLKCVDCHRNGIDHAIVRGYAGETLAKNDSDVATLSCQGCHESGRLGAPLPQHKGLPPLHFGKLTCTACHSGTLPQNNTLAVQTSLAHGLGIASETRTSQSPPYIVAPVFVKQPDGRLAPAKLVWPTFWGRVNADSIQPIAPQEVTEKAGSVLKGIDKTNEPLSEQVIADVLKALGGKDPAYIADGKAYRLSADGKITAEIHPSVQSYSWSLAHDVRGAGQALGVNGCTDCHTPGSPLFFGKIVTTAGAHATTKPVSQMSELEKVDPNLAQAWGLSFQMRPYFKVFAFVCAGLIAAVLLVNGFAGLSRLLKVLTGRNS